MNGGIFTGGLLNTGAGVIAASGGVVGNLSNVNAASTINVGAAGLSGNGANLLANAGKLDLTVGDLSGFGPVTNKNDCLLYTSRCV